MRKIYITLFLFLQLGCGIIDVYVFADENNKEPILATKLTKPVRGDGGINLAVAPGGGLNAYASIFWATEFANHAGKKFPELFDLFWGLSGGAIAATILMHDDDINALEQFKEQANSAYPGYESIFRSIAFNKDFVGIINDADGTRRKKFNQTISVLYQNDQFYPKAGNRFVLVASADNKPVCYADASLKLPTTCVYRVGDRAKISDGIINSCNFQLDQQDFRTFLPATLKFGNKLLPKKASLFQRQKVRLLPDNIDREVIDGVFADKQYLDGTSPLPLAIDYLRQFKTKNNVEHNLVVFDNGSSKINQEYRDSIKLSDKGFTTIKEDGATINVFVLQTQVSEEQFEAWMYDKSEAHWKETENKIRDSMKDAMKDVFERAVKTVIKNI